MEAKQSDKKKILVVDDNADSRELVMKVLKNKGYLLSAAVDGEDALSKITADKPDLILMDISMPKIDGHELTRRIKQQEELRDIKVIALTAHAMKGDKEKALAAGCIGYIAKPINVRKFSEQIQNYLSESV